MFELMNAPVMYAIAGGIVAFVALMCVVFMVRAYRAGVAMGLDPVRMKRAVSASATFAVLPSVGILLGVIALSGSLGTPLPWLRLSVIGALHYETQVAEAAAESVGIHLSASEMTGTAFATIALLMSFCICWGMIFSIVLTKKYSAKLLDTSSLEKKEEKPEEGPATACYTGMAAGTDTSECAVEAPAAETAEAPEKKKFSIAEFGDTAMTAMFIGLVSAYIASYIGQIVHNQSWIQLAVALTGALAMGIFTWLREKKQKAWIDNFSIAGSMLIAMAAAVLFNKFM